MCVCWRGAVNVLLRDCFQPAHGGMERWQGHRHVGAPPPTLGAERRVSLTVAGWLCRSNVCVCWRGAEYVRLRDCFQPARGGMGRWPGHYHVGAPLPALGAGRRLSLTLAGRLPKQHVCVCWRGAEYVLQGDCFQPARGCMGRWPGHLHAGAPPPEAGRGWGAPVHTAAEEVSHKPCACAGGGAEYVRLREEFQPTRGSMGRWPGH